MTLFFSSAQTQQGALLVRRLEFGKLNVASLVGVIVGFGINPFGEQRAFLLTPIPGSESGGRDDQSVPDSNADCRDKK